MPTRDKWNYEFKQTKDSLTWSSYKGFCQEVKPGIHLAEKEFMAQQIKYNRKSTNIMWKAIHSCIPKKSAFQRFFLKDINMVDTKNLVLFC